MAVDPNGESEFGGRRTPTGVQPKPHEPTASEKLSLLYRTGADTNQPPNAVPDDGEAFAGLLPSKDQTALRKQAGDLEKGQIWKEMNT